MDRDERQENRAKQKGKSVASDAAALAKAGVKAAAGDEVGAVIEIVKNPGILLRILKMIAFLLLMVFLFISLLICGIVGTFASIGSAFTSLIEADEWTLDAEYEEYSAKIEKMLKKAYRKCRTSAALTYAFELGAVKSAWEEMDSDADEVEISISFSYEGLFGDDVADDADDDTAAIDGSIIRLMCIYNLYNAAISEEESTAHESDYYVNITEDDNWDEYLGDVSSDYEEEKFMPTLRGLQSQIRKNSSNMFTAVPAGVTELSPESFSFDGDTAVNATAYYAVTVEDLGISYEGEGADEKSIQKYSMSVLTYIEYTAEEYLKDNVFCLSDGDYNYALGQAECYALILGKAVGSSVETVEIQEILNELRAQGISEERIALVESALEGVGRFQYSQARRSLTGSGPSDFQVGLYLDCSSFVQWAYWNAGLENDCYTTAYYAGSSMFYVIDPSEKLPGDVFWHQNSRGTRHVVIYAGNIGGQDLYIECTSPGSVMTYGDCYYGNISSYQYCYRYTGFSQ